MERQTLKEYISLFDSNTLMQYSAVRGMERLSEWGAAAEYWAKLEEKQHEDACRLIQKSIEIGNQYRAEIKPLNDWVDNTVASGLMTKEEAVKVVYNKMNDVYHKYYPKS